MINLTPPTGVGMPPTGPGPAGLDQLGAAMFNPPPPGMEEEQDPYANLDPKFLLDRFDKAKRDGEELRHIFERGWWQKLLYVLGRQWIYMDSKRNEWRDKRLKRWIPKPVTNKMREVVQSIRAMFSAVKLGVIVAPIGADPKNIVTANLADELQPIIHEEHQMDRVMRDGDFWFITCGNVFYYVWYDNDPKHGVRPILWDACLMCQTTVDPDEIDENGFLCPSCGGVQSKQVEVGEAPVGKGVTDSVSPFEILLPSNPTEFRDVQVIIRQRWREKRYYEDNYPELAPKLKFDKAPTQRSLHLFKSLASQSDLMQAPFVAGGGGRSESEGMTEYEYWEQPSKAFPLGLFFRVAGDSNPMLIEDPEQGSPGPIPTQTKQGKPIWPWIHAGYEPFGGRLWATGALDPLIQKQDMLNQLDSMILLIIMRMANPVWLEPKGAEVEKFDGQPGLIIKYNLIGTSGQGKPERIEGMGPPTALFTVRDQYLRDIEELAGTFDIIKGQKPSGVEAFSALQLLVERSQSRFTTSLNERGEAYRQWYAIALELERTYGPTDRAHAVLGPNKTWAIRHFNNANLQGQVSVKVEDGSNVPKTSLGKRAAIEQANNLRMIDPADPDMRRSIFTTFGLTELLPALDSSVQAALREQDLFEKWADAGGEATGTPPPLTVRPWDAGLDGQGISVRINELRKWANSDRMQQRLTEHPELVDMLGWYYEMLVQTFMMGPGGAAMGGGAGAPGGAPGAPAGGPLGAPGLGQAMVNSNRESGGTGNVPNNSGEDAAAPPM